MFVLKLRKNCGGLLLPLIGALDLVLLVRYRWSVPKVLALSAAVSVVFL